VGTTEAALVAWANHRSLSITMGSSSAARLIGLESVPVHDLVCDSFGISLALTVGSDGSITSEKVQAFGVCL